MPVFVVESGARVAKDFEFGIVFLNDAETRKVSVIVINKSDSSCQFDILRGLSTRQKKEYKPNYSFRTALICSSKSVKKWKHAEQQK